MAQGILVSEKISKANVDAIANRVFIEVGHVRQYVKVESACGIAKPTTQRMRIRSIAVQCSALNLQQCSAESSRAKVMDYLEGVGCYSQAFRIFYLPLYCSIDDIMDGLNSRLSCKRRNPVLLILTIVRIVGVQ